MQMSIIHLGIFARWILCTDSVSLWVNTITSLYQFKPKNLVVNYKLTSVSMLDIFHR